MLLGTLFKELESEAAAAEALLSLGDLALLAGVDQARAPHEETLGEYVSGATRRFSRLATDEEWLRLMTAMERSDRPDAACLATMLRWSIARDGAVPGPSGEAGCTCAGAAGGCHGGP